jgi:hypothetical protein
MWPAPARARGKVADGSPKRTARSGSRASSPSPSPSPPASRPRRDPRRPRERKQWITSTLLHRLVLLSRPPWLADIIDRHQAPIPTLATCRHPKLGSARPSAPLRPAPSTSAPSGQPVSRFARRRAPSPCRWPVGSWWLCGVHVGGGFGGRPWDDRCDSSSERRERRRRGGEERGGSGPPLARNAQNENDTTLIQQQIHNASPPSVVSLTRPTFLPQSTN